MTAYDCPELITFMDNSLERYICICRLYNKSSSPYLYPTAVACRHDGREMIRWTSSYSFPASTSGLFFTAVKSGHLHWHLQLQMTTEHHYKHVTWGQCMSSLCINELRNTWKLEASPRYMESGQPRQPRQPGQLAVGSCGEVLSAAERVGQLIYYQTL